LDNQIQKIEVLVIDDSPVMAKLTKRNVESFGYSVNIRNNSTAALSYVGNNSVDIILMDIELIGSRYDGIKTAKFIRKKYNIPVIFITGHDDGKIFEEANLDTMFNVVMKPYEPKQLKMQIEIALYNGKIQNKYFDTQKLKNHYFNMFDKPLIEINNSEVKFNNTFLNLIPEAKQISTIEDLFDNMNISNLSNGLNLTSVSDIVAISEKDSYQIVTKSKEIKCSFLINQLEFHQNQLCYSILLNIVNLQL